jgi:hypothetical protein
MSLHCSLTSAAPTLRHSARFVAAELLLRHSGRRSAWPTALAILLTIPNSHALATAPQVERCPAVVVAPAADVPAIDGKLDEPVWQQPAKLGPFVDIAGGPARSETHARLLRVGGALFIGFDCAIPEDADLKLDQTQRDSDVWTDESVEVFIDPGVTLRKYFHLVVNAANVQRDESGDKLAAPVYDASWNGAWQSATSRDASAWHAEIAIPLKEVGLKPSGSALLGLNVCRNDRLAGQETCWSPTISGFHQPVRFGVVSLPDEPVPAGIDLSVEGDGPATLGAAKQAVEAANPSDRQMSLRGLVIAGNEESRIARRFDLPPLAPGETGEGVASYSLGRSGPNALVVAARDAAGRAVALAKLVVKVSEAREQEYGYLVPGGEELGLWWAESMYKIHRARCSSQPRGANGRPSKSS